MAIPVLDQAVRTDAFVSQENLLSADREKVEHILTRELRNRYPAVAEVIAHVKHYRGKRLRPTLLLLAAGATGGIRPAHHILAAVVEMIHTATLVHDDILDGASVRRHVPTVNARWGTQTGVLLGDYLFTHAFYLASTVDAQACHLIGEATNRVCEGELCQGLRQGDLTLSEKDYLDIIEGKTAELIACCCRLGALYSQAPPEVVEALSRYGRFVGMAFQIADDLLDLVGEEEVVGKSLGTDLEQQKMTLPVIHLLASPDRDTAARAHRLLLHPDARARDELHALLEKTGSLRYARHRAEEYAVRARQELACLPPSSYVTILAGLTEKVIHRNA
jgi:octaprenyl-diphosphate synthase